MWDLKAYGNWKEDDNQVVFHRLMYEHADKILFEATGHEHMAGMRYSNQDPDTLEETSTYYMNKIIFPSMTANSNTQPSYSTFSYDTEAKETSKLTFTSLKLTESLGKGPNTPRSDLQFVVTDFDEKFGLKDFSGQGISDLLARLNDDPELARSFMFNKLGVDTDDRTQMIEGIAVYRARKLLRPSANINDAFLKSGDMDISTCVMSENLYSGQLQDCMDQKKMARLIDDIFLQ